MEKACITPADKHMKQALDALNISASRRMASMAVLDHRRSGDAVYTRAIVKYMPKERSIAFQIGGVELCLV